MTDGGTELKILQNKGNIEYSLASLSKTISMVSVNEVNKMVLFYLSLSIFLSLSLSLSLSSPAAESG